ncbi:MAG: class II aldolase/adducin family protein [Pigmentiphaga sp.]|uniref:class II aldolase/adducin family protein n=1 Tax=Pigmentiphaga sp. TaxID=1977564 RepID=UPI0029A94011|nr:class II aldolase/adducin family protein [Pigmentiphaga sp.]MDX3907641.1 class II aldolase/adducin family protein [Pigmentiphaga sp.]
MFQLPNLIRDLVTANHILADQGVVDAYGHVSVRHPGEPGQYLLSRSRSPELVEAGDIKLYHLDGTPVDDDGHQPYLERFIHGAIYEARPDVHAVIHSHAGAVLPFTVCDAPLVPVIHTASDMGHRVPLWNIHERFGDTNLLVTCMEHGRDMACCMGEHRSVLMRGHGFTTTGRSLVEAVKAAIYMPENARVLMQAMQMGKVIPLTAGEIEVRRQVAPDSPQMQRAWEYWSRRAGIAAAPQAPEGQ